MKFLAVLSALAALTFPLHTHAQASAYAEEFTPELSVKGLPYGLIADTHNSTYIFWVALESGRMHILERTADKTYSEIENIPISIGKKGYRKEYEGDQRTPEGIYQMTSFLSDGQLDDFYGSGAYPLNYPNSWDKLLKRTGYGIWLHGLPKGVDERPLLDSNGCVIINNKKLEEYSKYIDAGESTMVLAKTLDWQPPESNHEYSDVMPALERWIEQWESRNAEAYLSNYHEEFTDFRRDLAEWSTYKTRINNAKEYIDIDLSQLSVFAYPGEEDLVVSRFYQSYASSNYNWNGWKQLLWKRDTNGDWKIIFEGNG